jgi:L-fuculose-phosphate aldolase
VDLTEKLVNLGTRLLDEGLVVGAGGNMSIRDEDHYYVTPSGYAIGELMEEDLVRVNIETGEYEHEMNRPTCEYQMHINIYRKRAEVEVIIHAHPPYVIGVCSSGNALQIMTADAAAYLHPIRQIPYIPPGGQELADAVSDALGEDGNVCVMENHGAIALGRSCREAFMRIELLEDAAMTQFIASSAGTPRFFTQEQIDEINNLSAEQYRKKKAGEKD